MSATLIDTVYTPHQPNRWPFALAIAIIIHIHALLFIEFNPPHPDVIEDKNKVVQVSLTLAPPPLKSPRPETKQAKPKAKIKQAPTPTPQKKQPSPKSKIPQKKKTPTPKSKPAKKEQPKTKLKPFRNAKSSTAFDNANQKLKDAPKDARFKSSTNSEAANPTPKKHLPEGMAFSKGDHSLVTNFGKLGETETEAQRKKSDAVSGSTKKQGVPKVGSPPTPVKNLANLAGGSRTVKKPRTQTARNKNAKTDHHQKTIQNNKTSPQSKETTQSTAAKDTVNPPQTSSTPIPIESNGSLAKPLPTEILPKPYPAKKNATVTNNLNQNNNLNSLKKHTQPSPSTKIESPVKKIQSMPKTELDPEMQRALDIIAKATATEGGMKGQLRTPGQSGRKGELGQEGNGSTRKGNNQSTTDLITYNISSSSSKVGKLAFQSATDPKAGYLQRFFQRLELKWKAKIAAKTKTRFEMGLRVVFLVTIKKDGKISEIKIAFRSPGLSDQAVMLCKKSIEAASPLAIFPSTLEDKEQISTSLVFGY